MPHRLATGLCAAIPAAFGPVVAGLAMLAGSVLAPAASRAEGGYAPGLPYRAAPPAYVAPVRRCGPPHPCQFGPHYGQGVVHAYLPRNNALPMYNEPPRRFPD